MTRGLILFLLVVPITVEAQPLLVVPITVEAQPADSLTLGDFYRSARAHFPLDARRAAYREIARLQMQDADSRFLPALSARAQAIYQSDVPELPIQLPGVPEISKDQYQTALHVEQLVYDGGMASAQRRLAEATAEAALGQTDAEFHDRLTRINDAFFGALLQEAAAAGLESLRSDIEARRRALEVHVREGIASPGSLDELDVELLRIEQQVLEAEERRRASLDVLRLLTGLEAEDAVLSLPEPAVSSGASFRGDAPAPRSDRAQGARAWSRPEHHVFEATRQRLEVEQRLATLRMRPTISGSATAAYGRPPGMNIFENELNPTSRSPSRPSACPQRLPVRGIRAFRGCARGGKSGRDAALP